MNQSVTVIHQHETVFQTVKINNITTSRSAVTLCNTVNGLSDLVPSPSSGTAPTNKKASPNGFASRKIGRARRPKRENTKMPSAFLDHSLKEGFFTMAPLSPDEPIKSKKSSFSFANSSPDSGFVPEPDEPGQLTPGTTGFFIGTSAIGGGVGSYLTQEQQRKREQQACRGVSEVIPGKLYVGALCNLQCKTLFTDREKNIKKVVTAMATEPENVKKDLAAKNVQHKMIQIKDKGCEDIMQFFEEVNTFIDEGEGATLVHCHSGISRSVTLCLAYMVGKCGYSLSDAMKEMNEKRPISNPNLGFIGQLSKYARQIIDGSDSGLGSIDSCNSMEDSV